MSDIVPEGVDQTSGQSRPITPNDTLTDTDGNPIGRNLIFVEKKEVTGSAVGNVIFTGLSGEFIYEIESFIFMGANGSNCNYSLLPNGVATNIGAGLAQLSSSYAFSSVGSFYLGFTSTGADRSWGQATFWASKTSNVTAAGFVVPRSFRSRYSLGNQTGGGIPHHQCEGVWNPPSGGSVNVTSLLIQSSTKHQSRATTAKSNTKSPWQASLKSYTPDNTPS